MEYVMGINSEIGMVFEKTAGSISPEPTGACATLRIAGGNCILGENISGEFTPNQNGMAIKIAVEKVCLMLPNTVVEFSFITADRVMLYVNTTNKMNKNGKDITRRVVSLVKTISTNTINLCRNTPGQQVWEEEEEDVKAEEKALKLSEAV